LTDRFKDLDPAERKKLDQGIKKIDEVLAQGRFHPVVRDVLLLLQDEGGWINDFPLARLQELQATIVATEKPVGTNLQLVDAVFDLFKLSSALWDLPPAKHAATVLYALLEKIVVEKNLLAVVKGDAEFTPGHLANAKHSVGDEITNTAPKLGEAAPAGSIKAEKIIPKRRI
jgi:hypothetical protein